MNADRVQRRLSTVLLPTWPATRRIMGEKGALAAFVVHLAPVYGRFTDGFDTADLIDLKALSEKIH